MGLMLKEVDNLWQQMGDKAEEFLSDYLILTHGTRWAVSKGAENQGHSKATTIMSESSWVLSGSERQVFCHPQIKRVLPQFIPHNMDASSLGYGQLDEWPADGWKHSWALSTAINGSFSNWEEATKLFRRLKHLCYEAMLRELEKKKLQRDLRAPSST